MAQKYEKEPSINTCLIKNVLLVTAGLNAIVLNNVFHSVGVPFKKLKFSHIISRLKILAFK